MPPPPDLYLFLPPYQVWDMYKIGNQADKTSLLELPVVDMSSRVLFVGAGLLSLVFAFV